MQQSTPQKLVMSIWPSKMAPQAPSLIQVLIVMKMRMPWFSLKEIWPLTVQVLLTLMPRKITVLKPMTAFIWLVVPIRLPQLVMPSMSMMNSTSREQPWPLRLRKMLLRSTMMTTLQQVPCIYLTIPWPSRLVTTVSMRPATWLLIVVLTRLKNQLKVSKVNLWPSMAETSMSMQRMMVSMRPMLMPVKVRFSSRWPVEP